MDIGEVKQKIVEDKEKNTSSYRRYPVRFLFLEMNEKTQDEILDLVQTFNGELLDLSEYIMNKNDGWITKNKFNQIINTETSKTRDTFVLGFSELIRFFSKKEIESTVLSLFDIENKDIMDPINAQKRIYMICFSMHDDVYKVIQKSFTRKDLIDPFINAEYETSGAYREICFVSNEFAPNISKNKITSTTEWIGLWKHSGIIDFSFPIWCCSESLYEWHQKASPDNAFQIDVVVNTKEYLEKAYGLEILISYNEGDITYWNTLREDYIRYTPGKTIHEYIKYALNTIDISSMVAFAGRLFNSSSEYEKWLIRCYIYAYANNTFLANVLKVLKTNSPREFLRVVWKQGFVIKDPLLLSERIEIIKELSKFADSTPPEEEIENDILDGVISELNIIVNFEDKQECIHLERLSTKTGRTLEDLKKRMYSYYSHIFKPAFTGLSRAEKEFVIILYLNGVLDKNEIKIVYPTLYKYLFGQSEDRINDKDDYVKYIQAYRESKVAERDNDYLTSFYDSKSSNSAKVYNMYYELQRQETIVSKYDKNSDIYILDGVGAEYLPLIVELLSDNGYQTEYCDYAACHLPSITEINKNYLSSVNYKEWFTEFDRNVIHGDFYKTSTNLCKALDILQTKIKEITLDSAGKRIVITADHGATARARWTDKKKKYNFSGADHEGRCCRIADGEKIEETEDFIVYTDEINPGIRYIISINDQSLYNKPRYEDHGGATFEETLVPVIVAVPEGFRKDISYKVIDEKLDVSGLDKIVSFTIIPEPEENPYLIESNKEKHLLEKNGEVYSAKLSSAKEQKITVTVAGKEYSFSTRSKAKKMMEGDDGFDD